MKTTILERSRMAGLTFIVLSLLFSCTKDDDIDLNGQFFDTTGEASGAQHNPVVTSAGSAMFNGTYNTGSNSWYYTVDWANLNSEATAIQLYGPADNGSNGTYMTALSLSDTGTEGSASGRVELTEEQEAYLLQGRIYYIIMSTSNTSGEIRGQIAAAAK